VAHFTIECAETLVSITSVLVSQAEVIDYLSSQSFGQSVSFTGGGKFVVRPLNHLANHSFYRIVDKEASSSSYQSNLTPSTWGVTSSCVWNTFLSTRHFMFAVTYWGTCTIFSTIIIYLRCCYLPQVDTMGTLNSAHAMKLAVAFPNQHYRPVYAALGIQLTAYSCERSQCFIIALFVTLCGRMSLFSNFPVPQGSIGLLCTSK
jgi:hypothetical protein